MTSLTKLTLSPLRTTMMTDNSHCSSNLSVYPILPTGHIPLRHLVYRVHALPGSMRPLIWDFGQLKPDVERLYTNQIVSRYVST